MLNADVRTKAKLEAISRPVRSVHRPRDAKGNFQKVSDYYGENVFDVATAREIPDSVQKEYIQATSTGKSISQESISVIAKAMTSWATSRGATHFCHWFQPLTGSTAEKHDAFLNLDDGGKPIEELSSSQLQQGEPDASSFPNGGSRSTFEARGYTAWDMTSPVFLFEGVNGKTLCIPTAFVSYHGDALDIKTPLLRSVTKLSEAASRFMRLTGQEKVKRVHVTCGAEQEYFLIDKALYYSRPDLVMTGRTLFGASSSKHQQLEDHYFGAIPERVLSFMEELDLELHKLGIPAKTRHNEVAPAQFELAQIFRDANISADNNQLVMATIKNVASRHDLVALLHEKPFSGINGSGKHLNWSMATDTGMNLLSPGKELHKNVTFLTVTSIVVEAVYRHSKMLRAAIASAGNDHRLGANEAPPSIISVFLGETLFRVLEGIKEGKGFTPADMGILNVGATQLADLPKDNTDRNRTSPFAFTGNKFEFRAVGSSASIGLPLSIVNAAVSEVFMEACEAIEKGMASGLSVDQAQLEFAKKCLNRSWTVIFNGDGYSSEWVQEAERRGLPNLRTTPESLQTLKEPKEIDFLIKQNIFSATELETRFNVLVERFNVLREIEFATQIDLVNRYVVPSALAFKKELYKVIKGQKELGLSAKVEEEILKKVTMALENLHEGARNLSNGLHALKGNNVQIANKVADDLFPMSNSVASASNELEQMIPDHFWPLPTYFEMLFMR